MKKKLFKRSNLLNFLGTIALTALCCLIFLTCDQAPLFYNISIAPPKRDPSIQGSPCNIIYLGTDILADANAIMFVGTKNSESIYYNDKGTNGKWQKLSKSPGGYLLELATDGTYLYALLHDGNIMNSTFIKVYDPALKIWFGKKHSFTKDHSMQTLYGAGDKIFVGSQYTENKFTKYEILYFDTTDVDHDKWKLNQIKNETSLLSGAVEANPGNFFLATMGDGVFEYDGTAVTGQVTGTEKTNILGIIKTGTSGAIVATSSDSTSKGSTFIYDTVLNKFTQESRNINFTGAMGVWYMYNSAIPGWESKLLLLGIRGSSSNQGYREMILDTDGIPVKNAEDKTELRTPGGDKPTSVTDKAKYNASIGKHPVMSIRQAPTAFYPTVHSENDIPIFASTSVNGLWSYKMDNGEYQWNAEE